MKARQSTLVFAGFLVGVLAVSIAAAQHDHVIQNTQDIKWGEAPPFLPRGAQFAVVHGNPAEKGMFAIRAKMPANYKIPPHWHPTDEHVVVLSGALYMGMGDKLDTSAGKAV